MQITFYPCHGLAGQPETEISVSGDMIVIDGTAYDLSSVPEGGAAEPSTLEPFVGLITRVGGEIHCSVLAMLGPNAASSQSTDPAHWRATVTEGPVALPVLRILDEVTQ